MTPYEAFAGRKARIWGGKDWADRLLLSWFCGPLTAEASALTFILPTPRTVPAAGAQSRFAE